MPARKQKTSDALWRLTLRKLNIFFRRAGRHEVAVFLGFLLIASFFWVVETAYEETDSTYDVEFVVDDQPEGVVFTTRVPDRLRVSLRDNNLHTFRYYYGGGLRRLSVDFSRYADAVGNFRVSAAELQSLLLSDLLPTTQITSISPALVDARYAVVGGRRLPVRADAEFQAAPDYRAGRPVWSFDSVTVNAPSAMLDTMTGLATQHYVFRDLRDTLRADLQFALPLGVKATPSAVSVTVPVAQFVERRLERLPVEVLDVPDGVRLNIFPQTVDVRCLVAFGIYHSVVPSDFHLSVSYRDVAAASAARRRLAVRVNYDDKGAGVERVTVVPDSVEFLLEVF